MNNIQILKLYIFILSISFSHSSLIAQNNTSSPYSIFGLGDIEPKSSIRSTGMGGIGIALPSEHSVNTLNPASYTGLDTLSFVFDIGLMGKFTRLKSQNMQEKVNDFNINAINFGFKPKKWWALSFGLMPYSTIGYQFDNEKIIEGTTTKYINTIEGSGGLNQVYFGTAFKLWKNFSVGVNASYLFGNLITNELNDLVINNTSYSTNTENTYYLNNVFFDYGLQYQFTKTKWHYSIGIVFSNKQTLSSDFTTQTTLETTGEEYYSEENSAKDIVIPQSAGVGFALQIPERLLVSVDYTIQDWTENTFTKSIADYKISQSAKFGLEYKPEKSIGSSYFSYIDYRIGAFYSDLYYQLYGIPITEKGLSIGLGLPFRSSKANLSFEYAIKGTTQSGLVEENYFKIKLGLSLKQLWFQRRKFY